MEWASVRFDLTGFNGNRAKEAAFSSSNEAGEAKVRKLGLSGLDRRTYRCPGFVYYDPHLAKIVPKTHPK